MNDDQMIVIEDIKYSVHDKNFVSRYERLADTDPFQIGEVKHEIIQGQVYRRFTLRQPTENDHPDLINPCDGLIHETKKIVLGLPEDARDFLEIPLNHIQELEDSNSELRSKLSDTRKAVIYFKRATLWTRIKWLFTGVK